MEKFSEFLGQAGCLVGLGDPKAAGACSQDVTSPGNIQGVRSLHQLLPRNPEDAAAGDPTRKPHG